MENELISSLATKMKTEKEEEHENTKTIEKERTWEQYKR